jgi:hypothetical protein
MKLPSMSYRRVRGDLIEVYKYMHGHYCTINPFELNRTRDTRGHSFKIKKKFCKTNLRKQFFTNQVVDTWNALDQETVNAESVNSFKNRIDSIFKGAYNQQKQISCEQYLNNSKAIFERIFSFGSIVWL